MDQTTVAQLVTAQALSQAQLSSMALAAATQSVQGFDGWYSNSDVATWAKQLASIVQAIQSQAATTTDGYLAAVTSDIKGSTVSPAGTVKVSGLRKNVTPTEVYERVAETYRYQKSLGKTDQEALASAAQRAQVMAETDVALASRAQAQRFMQVKHLRWRRIVHPELSKSGACGLCIAASDRIYHQADLMPLHDRCKCTVLPIVGENDPGLQINTEDLKALYQQVGGTDAAKLKKARFTVHEHGQLGPILAVHGQHFRGPSDIPAAA